MKTILVGVLLLACCGAGWRDDPNSMCYTPPEVQAAQQQAAATRAAAATVAESNARLVEQQQRTQAVTVIAVFAVGALLFATMVYLSKRGPVEGL